VASPPRARTAANPWTVSHCGSSRSTEPRSPASLPAEQSKLRFAADYIRANDTFVDIIGAADSVGTTAQNRVVSEARADNTRAMLAGSLGVTTTTAKFGPTMNRFTRVEGVGASEPPPPALAGDAGNWRRVEILMPGFPAGAQRPPAGTPMAVTPHRQAPGVAAAKASSDPCVALLVSRAYP
jgi:hypothetical protein